MADALDDDPRLRVLLCLREDYLADVLSLAPSFPDGLRSRFRLSQLRDDQAAQAIEGPVAALGVSYAPGVLASLVNDLLTIRVETQPGVASEVRGEFVEPVQLQVVCSSLWRGMPHEATEITMDQLSGLGDVTTTLAAFYDDAIATTSARSRVPTVALRRWFEDVLITPSGTRGMAYRGPETTQGIPNQAVDALEDLHMIRAEARGGARWYAADPRSLHRADPNLQRPRTPARTRRRSGGLCHSWWESGWQSTWASGARTPVPSRRSSMSPAACSPVWASDNSLPRRPNAGCGARPQRYDQAGGD